MTLDTTTIIGYCGMILIAIQYLFIVAEKVPAFSLRSCSINLIGSILIEISLYYHYNAPSFIIEIFWASVSIYGIIRCLRK